MTTPCLMLNGNLSDSMKKLVENSFIRVRGCLVEKTREGFIIFGTEVKTMAEVEKIIDESARSLNNSIK